MVKGVSKFGRIAGNWPAKFCKKGSFRVVELLTVTQEEGEGAADVYMSLGPRTRRTSV